jgi:hypothetical protein
MKKLMPVAAAMAFALIGGVVSPTLVDAHDTWLGIMAAPASDVEWAPHVISHWIPLVIAAAVGATTVALFGLLSLHVIGA